MLKLLAVLSLASVPGFASAAPSDLVSGTSALRVRAARQGQVAGVNVETCAFDAATGRFSNCRNFGKRKFYTRAEVDTVLSRVRATRAASGAGGEWVMGLFSVGFFTMMGLILGGTIAAPLGGGIVILSVVGLGAGAGIGAVRENRIDRAIADGRARSTVTMNAREYEAILSTLRAGFNELD